jgi:hypothetical protein
MIGSSLVSPERVSEPGSSRCPVLERLEVPTPQNAPGANTYTNTSVRSPVNTP